MNVIKKVTLAIMASTPFITAGAHAAQCRVDVQNEIHLDGKAIEVVQINGSSARIEANNDLYIHGEKIELTEDQQAAIEQYRESMNEYLPKARKLAKDSLDLANDIIDDVAVSLEAPEAFEELKQSMTEFFANLESRYYKEGDLVIPAESFESMVERWAQDFEKAKSMFNTEFVTSAFNALSEKMQQEGSINLTELADTMAELKAKIEKRLEEHSADIKQQGEDLCDSLDDMVEQEQQLHKKIPALKDYQTFTI